MAGRLWSLGAVARHDTCAARRRWAAALFAEALPVVEGFGSPRAWVFTLLGLDPYCAAMPADNFAADMRAGLADRLLNSAAAGRDARVDLVRGEPFL